MMSLSELISLAQTRTEKLFHHYLKENVMPSSILQEAMAYSVLNGGKRLRPLLVYVTGLTLGADLDNLDAAACAVELMHSYSLIHDDLPAMDNADLRRGKPACHKVFGEAMAILAGDALQALVFEILATHPAHLSAEQRLEMIRTLSEASGTTGMAGGQALDMTIMDKNISLPELTHLYELKTGALLSASVKMGMLAATPQAETIQLALKKYAAFLGAAFQIQDDLLDVEGTEADIGKPQGLDVKNDKATYPALLGIEKVKECIQEKFVLALNSLEPLGSQGKLLHELAEHLLQRKN